MKQGRIIILNGVSSSGKSTLSRVLQDRSPKPLYRLDIDDFILMAPDKFNDYEKGDFSVQYAFASKFFHAVKLYSDLGFDLVVPYMFFKDSETQREFRTLLADYSVLVVNMHCPAEELRRRELSRQNRSIGSAESQLSLLETNFPNSITVDTCSSPGEACADEILRHFLRL